MSRRPLSFVCDGDRLFATLDEASGETGLLIVGGGNEIRSGAWSGQAQLAQRIAAAGHPVLRFDRRGVCDSEGTNRGFRSSRDDIVAALAGFRQAVPALARVVAFGNCDAASALALFGRDLGFAALVLANPWVLDEGDESRQAPAALRERYREKLFNLAEWRRLFTGPVNMSKLADGFIQAGSRAERSTLTDEMEAGLAAFGGSVSILLANRDRTAQLFAVAWPPDDPRIARVDSASHSFSDAAARDWLFERLLAALGNAQSSTREGEPPSNRSC